MANKSLTIKLTVDQQKQIKEATGKDVSELKISVAGRGEATQKSGSPVTGRILINEK